MACGINLYVRALSMSYLCFLGVMLWALCVYIICICSSSGKKSSTKSCALMKITKCTPEMKMQKILKSAEDRKRGLCKVYSNKYAEKSMLRTI